MRFKKGDLVKVIAGDEKGRKGHILKVFPKTGKVIVEKVHMIKKHAKPTQQNPQGGIIVKEAAMSSSKVMLVCPACKKPTRIKKTAVAGGFARTCKKCGEVIDK